MDGIKSEQGRVEGRGDACYPEIKGTQKKEEILRASRQLQKTILQSCVCGESRESACVCRSA